MDIPIEDKNGKSMGTLVLTDEADRILKYSSTRLVVEYDPVTEKAVGYVYA